MPLRNWQQHAEPASAPPAIDGARETEQPVLPRGRVLGVSECVSQGLSSQKRHPAELDNVDQLIYDMCGRRRLQVSAWLRPADATAPLLNGRKALASCSRRTLSARRSSVRAAVQCGSAIVLLRVPGSVAVPGTGQARVDVSWPHREEIRTVERTRSLSSSKEEPRWRFLFPRPEAT